MKAHTQTIINVSLAIAVTLLIYQNNQLKDNVETLKGYAQLDTDKTWDRMDEMEANNDSFNELLKEIKSLVAQNSTYIEGLSLIVEEHREDINLNRSNIDIAFDNFDVSADTVKQIDEWTDTTAKSVNALNKNVKINADRIDKIVEYLQKYP